MTRREFIKLSAGAYGLLLAMPHEKTLEKLLPDYEIMPIDGYPKQEYILVSEKKFFKYAKMLKPWQRWNMAATPGQGLVFKNKLVTPYRVKGWKECVSKKSLENLDQFLSGKYDRV